MSTTTNFKRIALVAVAALGLGVLSSVPSNAAINADLLSVSSATASQTTAETQTATSATATLSFSGNGTAPEDSMTLTASLAEFTPATAGTLSGTNLPYLTLKETVNASVNSSVYLGTPIQIAPNTPAVETTTAAGSVSATYFVYIASSGTARATVAGTYKVKLTPALNNGKAAANAEAKFITITVSTAATLDVLADATNSKVFIQKKAAGSGNADLSAATTDSVVVVAKAALATVNNNVATIYQSQKNAANGSASESVSVTIAGPGTLSVGADGAVSQGRALTATSSDKINVFADGNAGEAVITLTGATSGKVIATKKVVFYGDVASFTATGSSAIVGVSATVNKAVTFLAKDSASNTLNNEATLDTWYAFSSDTSVATVPTAALTTYSDDSGTVAVTGVKIGTATITIGNKSTLALSTIKSAPVTVRVGSAVVASVKVAFDKATYAPGEKAIITVSPLDSTNLPVVPVETEFWSTGLAVDKAFMQGSIPASDTKTTAALLTDATVPQTAGIKTYVVYMPSTPGLVTLTGTLVKAAPLAAAIQGTVVTASATVSDSGSAALAAVTALATTVASLRTLIVTLTNLVLKIQKKVKA